MSSFQPEVLDKIVFAYLKRNKQYQNAANEMRKHSDALLDDTGVDDVNSDIANQLAAYLSDVTPERLEEAYSHLTRWIASSLDQYRNELYTVTYPIFVHVYLDMLYRGHELNAEKFMINHQHEHADMHGTEIQALIAVRTLEQMKENTTVKLFRTQKYRVSLCKYSFDLLMAFLQEHKYLFLVNLLNQHIDMVVRQGKPAENIDPAKIGHNLATDAVTEEEVFWGNYNALDLEEDEQDDDDDDAKSVASKMSKRSARTGVSKKPGASSSEKHEDKGRKKKRVPDDPAAPPHELRPTFPPLTTRLMSMKTNLVRESKKKIDLSAKALPSCCMYTFFNAVKVTTVTFSDDGKLVAAGCSDSSVRVWSATNDPLLAVKNTADINEKDISAESKIEDFLDASTASIVKVMRAHSSTVTSVAFSPDNLFLLSSSVDCTVRLWSLLTFKNVVCYRGHNYPVWHVAFSPLSLYFVTASHDRTARLWTTDKIYAKRIYSGHLSDVHVVEFHPNATYIATGSSDKSARLWEVTTGKCVRVFQGHRDAIHTLAFSHDGRFLATGADDWDVILWDIQNGNRVRVLHGHSDVIYTLQFCQGDSVLASGGADDTVRIWDLDFLPRAKEATVAVEDDLVDDLQPGDESAELAATYFTKSTPVYAVHFGATNYLVAAGVFVKDPENH